MAKAKNTESKMYVCLRPCFAYGRKWIPQAKAVREKDYLLKVAADTVVSKKNFKEVKATPKTVEEKNSPGVAVSKFDKSKVMEI